MRDQSGQTSVYYAAEFDHVEVFKLLLEFDGDEKLADNHENTPLQVTEWYKTAKVVELLTSREVQ